MHSIPRDAFSRILQLASILRYVVSHQILSLVETWAIKDNFDGDISG